MGKKIVKKAKTKKVEAKEIKEVKTASKKGAKENKEVVRTSEKEVKKVVETKEPNNGGVVKRLSDKEFAALEKQVREDNKEFEQMISGVLLRREWHDLLKEAIKHQGKTLTKDIKDKLNRIAKFTADICEEDVIDLTLVHFSGSVSYRRRQFAIERSLRKKERGDVMSAPERLLAEIFGEEKKDK